MKKNAKKPTNYSDFSLTDLEDMFGIQNEQKALNLPQKKISNSTMVIGIVRIA
jgi:hypothetical protein